jgi:predicted phage terminase large subunit-like protein
MTKGRGTGEAPSHCAALVGHGYDATLRGDFANFAERAFIHLHPRARFAINWHIDLVAARLARVLAGDVRRLVVNLPPRHLKSHLGSVAFPAWWLGHRPQARILCVSYAQELAEKLSRDCRHIVASAWYRQLFSTRLSRGRNAAAEFETTAQGYRLATSLGGVVTGRGADLIVIDDPLKAEEAVSRARREAANEWFDQTLYSRLDDKERGAIVLVMHRLHEDDLTSHVLAQEAWEVLRLPAIAEADERWEIAAALGPPRHVVRRAGEALHPEREPLATLEKIRRTLGEYNFAGQYQQMPAPLEGGLVRAAWFARYREGDLPLPFERLVQSWDTANKPSELNDFSVCTSWGVSGTHVYLLDVYRRRLAYPELKRAVCERQAQFGAEVVLIEDRASGTQLIQDLVADGLAAVTAYRPCADKVMRLHAQSAMIENGFVHLPERAPWLAEYLHEMTIFPRGRHDDQVDSTAQFLDWLRQPMRGAGLFDYYRMLAERR